jgi:hypothetical protein
MPPAFTSTGISPSGLNKVAMRPPSYRVPLKKSNHSPCGSQASAPASSVSGSACRVMGAAIISLPN